MVEGKQEEGKEADNEEPRTFSNEEKYIEKYNRY